MREIFASAPVSSTELEVITLKAPWFDKIYYLQNVSADDLEVVLENNETVIAEYAPMSIGHSSSNADLNYERNITIQYVNDIIAEQTGNFDPDVHNPNDGVIEVRGYIYYRDGSVSSLQTSVTSATIREITRDSANGTSSILMSSKPANESSTGEVATINRVPMLRGFL